VERGRAGVGAGQGGGEVEFVFLGREGGGSGWRRKDGLYAFSVSVVDCSPSLGSRYRYQLE